MNRHGRTRTGADGRLSGLVLSFCCVVLILVCSACKKPSPSQPSAAAPSPGWFEEVSLKLGVNFRHDPGPPLEQFFMPQSVGSGAAFLDYDNDGRLDILLLQDGGPESKSPHRLYHQEPDGKFKDVTAGCGLDVTGYGMGVAVGDVNNDGFVDVLVTEYRAARLFLNSGQGSFREVTKEAGIDNPIWAISAAFVDYDRDGWLDLVVVNYIDWVESEKCYDRAGRIDYCGPMSSPGMVSKLFHNLGHAPGKGAMPRFEDVTVKSGLVTVASSGLGITCADFNGDGWQDILISNDARPNSLWMNQKNGTFVNEALQRGIAYNEMGIAQANMGIAIGDINNDGLFDIYITHLTEENNILWMQGPRGQFQDRTAKAELAATVHRTGFGTLMADVDNDGFLDLVLANGRVRRPSDPNAPTNFVPALGPHWSVYGEPNQLFAGDGTGKFKDVSSQSPAYCGTPTVGRGLACGDFDNDGALDLLISAIAEPGRLYRNTAPKRGHWLIVRAVEPALGGRDAYGAEIRLQTTAGPRIGWVIPSASFCSSCDPRVHFGLGAITRVDSIRVLWPEGEEEIFPSTGVDQLLVIRKGEGSLKK